MLVERQRHTSHNGKDEALRIQQLGGLLHHSTLGRPARVSLDLGLPGANLPIGEKVDELDRNPQPGPGHGRLQHDSRLAGLVVDARNLVQQFLENAHNNGMRTVLISHGKGLHSERPGFLKSYVMHWLEESYLVLAFHSTPANRGGSGATQVLVRKNGQARQRNREFFIEAGKHQR